MQNPLSFSTTKPNPIGVSTGSKAPIETFATPRFEGDSGIYSYTFYQGCKILTISGVTYIRDCYGRLRVR
jgi:hypothetical protein